MTSTATINLGSIKSNTKLNIKKVNTTSKSINLQMDSTTSDYDEIDYSIESVSTDLDSLNIDYSSFKADLLDGIETGLATGTIVVTSVVSGVLKIVEYIIDGLTWVGGAIVSGIARITGNDELAAEIEDWTMNQIAKDRVAELNESFYANTELGKTINEKSAMKYDSDLAKGIQNSTTKVVEVAGATAATVATGGAAAPALFAVGFAEGAGESAEEKFQDTENRDFWKDSGGIAISGSVEGLSMVGTGQAGSKALKGAKEISKIGVKKVFKSGLNKVGRDILKGEIKSGIKTMAKNAAAETLKDPSMYIEVGCVLSDDIQSGIETGDWDFINMAVETGTVLVSNYASNISSEYLNDVFDQSLKNAKMGQKNYKIKEDEFNNYYVNEPGDKPLDDALKQQYKKLKKAGYEGSFENFRSEYATGNFNTNSKVYDKIKNEIIETGAVTSLDGNSLNTALQYGGIGYPDSDLKHGGNWATTTSEQQKLKAKSSDSSFERAAKGIDKNSAQNGSYEIRYSKKYCRKNVDKIAFNSGPNNVMNASSASMPGGFTYDLNGNGNGTYEFLMPRIELSNRKIREIKFGINNGKKSFKLGDGLTLVKVN